MNDYKSYKSKHARKKFTWSSLGDIEVGRENLGSEMPVLVYRLLQFTMKDVLNERYGPEESNEIFRDAGFLAGTEFAKNNLDLDADFDGFVANLQETLKSLKIGILRLEEVDQDKKRLILTIAEDLDCSGLPITDETVCDYDEGFIAGIMTVYTGQTYDADEIDCWASGDRVCRFKVTTVE